MATLPLVPAQLDAVLQAVTISMLGLAPPDAPQPGTQDPSYFAVRCGWQQLGQPFQKITDDVTYVRALEVDDGYNRVRDVQYTPTADGATKTTSYTRVWEAYWTVYGPRSTDNARLIRTRLHDQDIHDQLSASQLYFVPDPAAPTRAPEFQDGQWWERVDFRARLNEFVTETLEEGAITSAEIIVENELGVQTADITVQEY